jgi:hypothetical protein
MSGRVWTEVVGAIGIFTLLTTVITVTIWQLAATWRAKALLGREQEYRKLAETAVGSQDNIERQLAELNGRLAETQSRIDSIERILKEVE